MPKAPSLEADTAAAKPRKPALAKKGGAVEGPQGPKPAAKPAGKPLGSPIADFSDFRRPLDDARPARPVGLDRRSANRLRRGQMAIEATLDLHGMTQAAAQPALETFLTNAQRAGLRCVLVVTGKGRSGEDPGVLRRRVPQWLSETPNRRRVLALAPARPQHGGGGALYILIRRLRA